MKDPNSFRVAMLVASSFVSACCDPTQNLECCGKSGDVFDFYDPAASNMPRSLESYADAGLESDVVYHGENCRLVCQWAATTCYFGPLDCLEEQRRYWPPAWPECNRFPDGGSAPRFHPERVLVRCAPGIVTCTSGRQSLDATRLADVVLSYLPMLALLEHESITAFTEMASFLALHNAPASLLSRLAVAAEDESRHTQAMLVLSEHLEKFTPDLPTLTATHPPSLFEFAIHNAREGCVRETYGASLAHYQAQHATDPLVRDTFATIAIEESQHAQLSWDVAQWVDTLLTESESAAVAHAILEATEELAQSLAHPSPREWRDTLGLPSADVALAMHHQLRRALWTAHAAS